MSLASRLICTAPALTNKHISRFQIFSKENILNDAPDISYMFRVETETIYSV